MTCPLILKNLISSFTPTTISDSFITCPLFKKNTINWPCQWYCLIVTTMGPLPTHHKTRGLFIFSLGSILVLTRTTETCVVGIDRAFNQELTRYWLTWLYRVFFYMLSHVSFNYSKTINVTFTSFANLELDIGGRLYSKFQLTMWSQSLSVGVQIWNFILFILW